MRDIYVNKSASGLFNGTSWADAYEKIGDALNDANGAGNSTIHIAPGTYEESRLYVMTANVKIRGRDPALTYDALGLPTGAVTDPARWKLAGPAVTLLTVNASGFEVTNMVFDGGISWQREINPALLVVDGGVAAANAHTSLQNIWIHGNAFQDGRLGLSLRLANATIEGNFIARNAVGVQSLAGFDPGQGSLQPVQQVTFNRNRVVDNANLGVSFAGHVGSKMMLLPPFTAGPGANDVVVTNNDFTGNGDGRDPTPNSNPPVYYPQNIQYAALLFNVMHGGSSDQNQSARVDAKIRNNTFRKNGYGVAVGQRLIRDVAAWDDMHANAYPFVAELSGNTYCANGLNSLFVDFRLIAESHGATISDLLRYAKKTEYWIDATGDALTMSDVDYDHPVKDPNLSQDPPLENKFTFNGDEIAHGKYFRWRPKIQIADTTPPRIRTATAVPAVLQSTGDLVPVSIAIDARDGCDPTPRFEIIGVTSNEAIQGPPSPTLDYEILGPLSLHLRAKRAGNTASRIYTVTVRCTDHAGNSSTKDVSVVVPLPLSRMWLGMLTRNSGGAGSNGPIVLIVNESGVEKVHETFSNTVQGDQQQGQASLYALDVSSNDVVPENLGDSSIRVAIRGDNTWEPEHVVVWGERNGTVVPLAMETDLHARGSATAPLVLSTNKNAGDVSFPLRLVSGDSPIDGILVLMTTADLPGAGIANPAVELEITANGGTPVVNHIFDAPPQQDQKKGQANLYFIPVSSPFDAIRLKMHTGDRWRPASFFLFGTRDGERPSLVPLVHLPEWPHGWMSTIPGKGLPSVSLWQG